MNTKFKVFQEVIDAAGNCYVILNAKEALGKEALYDCLNILSFEIKEFTHNELIDIWNVNIKWWKIVIKVIKEIGEKSNFLNHYSFSDLCIWKLYCTLEAYMHINYDVYKKMLKHELSRYYHSNPLSRSIYDGVINGCIGFGTLHDELTANSDDDDENEVQLIYP